MKNHTNELHHSECVLFVKVTQYEISHDIIEFDRLIFNIHGLMIYNITSRIIYRIADFALHTSKNVNVVVFISLCVVLNKSTCNNCRRRRKKKRFIRLK